MLTNIFSDEIAYIIAMTLIHSIWQISLVAILLGFILHFNKNASNNTRYYLSLSALGISVLLSVVTFSIYLIGLESGAVQSGLVIIQPVFENNSLSSSLFPSTTGFISKYLFVIVNAWILGSILFFIRFTGGYLYLKHIIRKSDIQNNILNKSLKKLNKKFRINRTVEIKESGMISSPLVMGFFKPIILFPIGLLNNLSVSEVDSILAHELAHIKRHDYLFKLFQSFAEIIFYYHPGIWYISSQISFNRELCCDDMAIDYTGSSVSYAKTLVKLQEMKVNKLNPALAFSGNKNQFKNRILRLLDIPVSSSNTKHKILAFFLIFSTVFAFARGEDSKEEQEKFSPDIYFIDDCVQNIEEVGVYLDTIPEKNSFHIKKHTKEEQLELEMKDGNITKLKIDGDEIPEEEYEKYEDIIIKLSPEKGNRVITVFPDCEKDLGNIFYMDNLENEIIILDSIIEGMEINKFVFPKGALGDFEFKFGDINKLWADSLKNQVYAELLDKELLEQGFVLDSVFDLLPEGVLAFPKHIHEDIRIKFFGDEDYRHMEWFSEDNNDIIIDMLEKEKLFDEKRRKFKHKKHDGDENLFFFQPHENLHLFEHNSGNVSDIIGRHLLNDRLVESKEKSKIELSGKHMKINGEKQPTNIWKKYKHLYEENTGLELTKKSKLEFEIKPNSRRESYIRKLI